MEWRTIRYPAQPPDHLRRGSPRLLWQRSLCGEFKRESHYQNAGEGLDAQPQYEWGALGVPGHLQRWQPSVTAHLRKSGVYPHDRPVSGLQWRTVRLRLLHHREMGLQSFITMLCEDGSWAGLTR